MKPKTVAIASDHRGTALKHELIVYLQSKGYQPTDFGVNSEAPCDYPDFGFAAAEAVGKGVCDRGIVICHSGIGMSIVANKVKGVRASLCRSVEEAELTRQHNDANVLSLGSGYTPPDLAKSIVLKWLTTEFEGGRHERRLQKISSYEKQS